ncbi:helix-turn-helix domain-containing protein [Nocardia noduli]|uniref:helix-turn-helix domain-containing protein n=1 Tax=Nocardia noduli TaxID=2815722 RepID=UPI001C22ABD0|nr:hypothetical protein [Nocardia noduli]
MIRQWTPAEIIALRKAAILSPPEFASKVGVTARTVILWENGQSRKLHAASTRLLQAMLDGADETVRRRFRALLDDPTSTNPSLALEMDTDAPGANRREFLAAVAAAMVGSAVELARWRMPLPTSSAPLPEQIGASDVTRLRRTADGIRDLDSRFGGGYAVDPTLGVLSRGAAMLSRCRDENVLRDLYVALADLSNIVAWAHHDAGQQQRARLHLAQGLRWALEAGTLESHSISADLLFGLARVELHEHDPHAALEMVQLGQIAATKATDTAASAQLHATAAWAYAQQGNHRLTQDSLARCEHEIGLTTTDSAGPWMQVFFSPGDYAGHRALVHGVLAANVTDRQIADKSATAAVELTATARAASGPGRPVRSMLFDSIVAATNSFRVGDVESAIPHTQRVITGLGDIATQRGIDRLADITAAATPHIADSTVADLLADIDQLVSA